MKINHNNISSIRRLWHISHKKYLFVAQILLNIYLAMIALYVSRLAQRTIDEQLILLQFHRVMLQFVMIAVTGIVASYFLQYVKNKYAVSLTYQLREDCTNRLLLCQYEYIENEHSGTIINKLTNDVTQVSDYLASSLPAFLGDIISFICSFLYLIVMDWPLTLVCAICVPITVWMTKKFTNPTYQMMEQFWEEMDQICVMAKDTVMEEQVEKAYNLQQVRRQKFDQQMDYATGIYRKFEKLMAKSGAYKSLLKSAPTLLCILAGFIAAYIGNITAGVFAGFVLLLSNISSPLSKMISYITEYKEAQVSMDRVVDILEIPLADAFSQKEQMMPIMAEVSEESAQKTEQQYVTTSDQKICYSFHHVGFSYGDSRVLQDLNGQIETGKMTAIVGKSGGGKSTLFKLLAGLYPVSEGSISLYGKDLYDWNLKQMRQKISYVEQKSFLFHQSIAENIAAGREDATLQQIVDAAKKAYAHDFIMRLPDGYQTILQEGGNNLSGGQRQRIAIARAFFRNTDILLLDEMTSALDVESEKLIQNALEEYRKNRTVIVVAHRLSTIIGADKIMVMNEGKITEEGTHEELLQRNGVYASLYRDYKSADREGMLSFDEQDNGCTQKGDASE